MVRLWKAKLSSGSLICMANLFLGDRGSQSQNSTLWIAAHRAALVMLDDACFQAVMHALNHLTDNYLSMMLPLEFLGFHAPGGADPFVPPSEGTRSQVSHVAGQTAMSRCRAQGEWKKGCPILFVQSHFNELRPFFKAMALFQGHFKGFVYGFLSFLLGRF